MSNVPQPWQQEAVIYHSQCLLHSYKHWTERSLLDISTPTEIAQALFEAPFVLVSHGTESNTSRLSFVIDINLIKQTQESAF